MNFLIGLCQIISNIIVYIIDTLISIMYHVIAFIAEKILLGVFGIFNIFKSKDTELISALVLAVIYTLAVVYIVHIIKAYCKKKHITIFQIKRVSKNTTRKKTTKTKRNSTKPKKTATSKKNTKTKAKTKSKPKTQAKKAASR